MPAGPTRRQARQIGLFPFPLCHLLCIRPLILRVPTMGTRRTRRGSRWRSKVNLASTTTGGKRCELGIFRKKNMPFGSFGCSDGEGLLDSASGGALAERRGDARGREIAEMGG